MSVDLSYLEIRGARNQREVDDAITLMANNSNVNYLAPADWLLQVGNHYPNFQNEHIRIAIYRGKIVSALRITTDTIRLGESRLKMGGIGWISTAGPFRNKGIASALIQNAVKYMSAHGYNVSMLFGIPNFYHRFGFVTTIPEYYTTILTRDALTCKAEIHKVRTAKPGDVPFLQKIHFIEDKDIACSIIRTQAHFALKWREWSQCRVLLNDNGKVIGYFLPRQDESNVLSIYEMGADDFTSEYAVLYAIAKHAEKERCGVIKIFAPPCHPILKILINQEYIYDTHTMRSGGGMVAVVNLEETLECMIPEWEKLLQNVSVWNKTEELTLIIGGAPYCFSFHKGSIVISPKMGKNKISMSLSDFIRLLTGFIYWEEIIERNRFILSSLARELLSILFPKRYPYVWHLDRF